MLPRSVAVAVLLVVAGVTAQQPQPAGAPSHTRSPRNANYRIAATLDPNTHTINGTETITWRNIAKAPAPTLQFHLYYNAWRDARSTWMRERAIAGSTAALLRLPPEDWAAIDVTRLAVARAGAATDLTAYIRFIAPDDGNGDDRTVIEVPLDTPVGPGETVDIEIAWTTKVPRTFARTGRVGHFYFLAQWFPKIGVFEDTGWNCHQFHASTEFFADFGTYDAQLTVPKHWVVGATGRERARMERADGQVTHHYYEEDVHDFAWTTSPRYVERRERFEHPTLPAVDIRLLLQPEHEGQAGRHFAATRAALKLYGEWYGPYPYGHVTVIDPAFQSGAGGMEYPTLFTAGTRWLAPRQALQPESVTVHEAGHQFWYGIVATNEFEHAWMDEGLNTFTQARVLAEAFDPNYYVQRYFGGFVPWVFRDLPLSRDVDYNRMPGFRNVARLEEQSTPTWRYWPASSSSFSYNKTALWLHTLERLLGWPTLQRAMATYFARHAFRHPQPDDFFAAVNEASGQDLTWFFNQVYRGAHDFDYSIDSVRSEREGDTFKTAIVARRLGEGLFPVEVRVVFEDGEQHQWQWDGRERWKRFETRSVARAAHAEVDPNRVLLLDIKRTNNSVTLQPRAHAAARKWSLAWLVWLQDQLLTYGFFV